MKKNFLLMLVIYFNQSHLFAVSDTNNFSTAPPSGFIENKGQVVDQTGKTNTEVKFIYSDGPFNLQLKKNGFSYELFESKKITSHFPESGFTNAEQEQDFDQWQPSQLSSNRIDVSFEGCNSDPEIAAGNNSGTSLNYFINPGIQKGVTSVGVFEQVTYRNIYPGIDLIFTASENHSLEYFFRVHPGAHASDIRMQYNGASSMSINNGELQLGMNKGLIHETNLRAFIDENKMEIPCSIKLKENEIHFSASSFSNQTLIIDPNIIWGTYYGGEGKENIDCKITIDTKGKAVIVGTTSSTTYIASTGSYQTTYGGDPCDFCIAKFKSNGKLDWSTYFGGTDQDIAYNIASDNKNNIYVAGNTTSDNLATANAYQTRRGGQGDAIIAKFDASGNLIWSTYYGGKSPDEARSICVDNNNGVYISGYCNSTNGIATPGAFQETYGGNGDAYCAKFNSDGQLKWGTYFSGSGQDRGHAVNVDLKGAVYIAGTCESTEDIASSGAFQAVFGGVTDVFLAKFDTTDGHFNWSTYYGGAAEDHGRGISFDVKGNVYLSGFTFSTNNIATPGAYQTNLNAVPDSSDKSSDAFIAKFTSSGKRLWGTYYGGNGNDYIYSACTDNRSIMTFAGSTTSPDHIATANALQKDIASSQSDGLLIQVDTDGNILLGTYYGGIAGDSFYGVAEDAGYFVYPLMMTCGIVEASEGVYQTENNGQSDYAFYKIYTGSNCFDANEANETLQTAKLVTASTDTTVMGYYGNIANAGDQDWFKVKASSDAPNLKIELMGATQIYNLNLYDSKGVLLQSTSYNGLNPQNMIFNNSATGTFYVQVAHDSTQYDPNNCYELKLIKSSAQFPREESTTAESATEDLNLSIAPNPVAHQLKMNFTSPNAASTTVTIYDLMHRPVFSENFKASEGFVTEQFDLPLLASGAYILELQQNDVLMNKQIIISQ